MDFWTQLASEAMDRVANVDAGRNIPAGSIAVASAMEVSALKLKTKKFDAAGVSVAVMLNAEISQMGEAFVVFSQTMDKALDDGEEFEDREKVWHHLKHGMLDELDDIIDDFLKMIGSVPEPLESLMNLDKLLDWGIHFLSVVRAVKEYIDPDEDWPTKPLGFGFYVEMSKLSEGLDDALSGNHLMNDNHSGWNEDIVLVILVASGAFNPPTDRKNKKKLAAGVKRIKKMLGRVQIEATHEVGKWLEDYINGKPVRASVLAAPEKPEKLSLSITARNKITGNDLKAMWQMLSDQIKIAYMSKNLLLDNKKVNIPLEKKTHKLAGDLLSKIKKVHRSLKTPMYMDRYERMYVNLMEHLSKDEKEKRKRANDRGPNELDFTLNTLVKEMMHTNAINMFMRSDKFGYGMQKEAPVPLSEGGIAFVALSLNKDFYVEQTSGMLKTLELGYEEIMGIWTDISKLMKHRSRQDLTAIMQKYKHGEVDVKS